MYQVGSMASPWPDSLLPTYQGMLLRHAINDILYLLSVMCTTVNTAGTGNTGITEGISLGFLQSADLCYNLVWLLFL